MSNSGLPSLNDIPTPGEITQQAADITRGTGLPGSDIVADVMSTDAQYQKGAEKAVEPFVPIIAAVGLQMVGVPAPLTMALITAAKGGSIQDIAISAMAAYAGGAAGSAFGNAGMYAKIATSAAGGAAGGAARAALSGRDILAGATKGAENGLTNAGTALVAGGINSGAGALVDGSGFAQDAARGMLSGAAMSALQGKDAGAGALSGAIDAGSTSAINSAADAIKGWVSDVREIDTANAGGSTELNEDGTTNVAELKDEKSAATVFMTKFKDALEEQAKKQAAANLASGLKDEVDLNGGQPKTQTRRTDSMFTSGNTETATFGPGNINENQRGEQGFESWDYASLGEGGDNLTGSLIKYLDSIGRSPIGDASKAANAAKALNRKPKAAEAGTPGADSNDSMLGGVYDVKEAKGFDSFANWANEADIDKTTAKRFYG